MATDIFLYHGETTPSDIKLRDPTQVARSTKVAVPVLDAALPAGRTVYYQSLFAPVALSAVSASLSWLSPLSVPLPNNSVATHVNQTDIYFTPTLATGWQSQSSVAPKPAPAQQGYASVPFFTPSLATGWQSQSASAAPVAKAQQGSSFVPFNTFQINTQSVDKWQSPLSIAVPVAKALPGNSFVPFDTFQINTQRIDKWLVPLSKPVPVAQAQQGNTFVPFNTFQINTATVDKWLVPLSMSVPPVASAPPGSSFVPFNTAQVSVNFTAFGWHQALSVAVPVAKAVAFWTVVPFDTTQPQDIEGMAWWMPLGVVPFSVVYAPQQYVVEPPQFGEIAAAPSSAALDPMGDYSLIPLYRRKLEDELEEIEIKLRDIAIDIPLPGHSEPVIYDRPLLEPFSDKQQTIKVLVSRRAEVHAQYLKLLKAQQDDDDDDAAILLLWP